MIAEELQYLSKPEADRQLALAEAVGRALSGLNKFSTKEDRLVVWAND